MFSYKRQSYEKWIWIYSRDIVRALIKLDKYDVKIWSVPWGSTPQNIRPNR